MLSKLDITTTILESLDLLEEEKTLQKAANFLSFLEPEDYEEEEEIKKLFDKLQSMANSRRIKAVMDLEDLCSELSKDNFNEALAIEEKL